MNRISAKLLSIIAIFLFISIIPIAVFATNEDISIVATTNSELEQEYTIYIKGISKQNFKYAFTNIKNADPDGMDLSYINSILDLGGNQAAFLDAATYKKLSENGNTIYMWAKIKDENGNEKLILKDIQLDLSESLSEENLEKVETLTKRITVEIADNQDNTTTVRNEKVDGVDEVANVGYVKIVDDKKATYYYEMVKLPSTEQYNKLNELVEQLNNEYDQKDMYGKVQTATEFNELFTTATDSVDWKEVKDMTIKQDEESKAGDKYIILLKKVAKVDGKEVETLDVQFLTADDNYIPNVEIEKVVTQETTKLPITYDSIALFVILGIIVLLVIVVFIRMKKLSKKNEEK